MLQLLIVIACYLARKCSEVMETFPLNNIILSVIFDNVYD